MSEESGQLWGVVCGTTIIKLRNLVQRVERGRWWSGPDGEIMVEVLRIDMLLLLTYFRSIWANFNTKWTVFIFFVQNNLILIIA